MSRKAASTLRVDPNVRAARVYPTKETKRRLTDLKTVGIKLSREHAIHLARVLLAMTQDFEFLDVTAYRFEPRKSDGTFQVTVTGVA